MGMVWVMTVASDQEVAQLRDNPSAIYDFVNSQDAYESGRTLDLDKQWHAVHFLLTGSAEITNDPLSLIIGRFEEIGPDNGYGPAWFVPKDFITNFNNAISSLSYDELVARYDTDAMVHENVYIADALASEGEEGRGFVLEDVARLRAFVATAAADGSSAFALIT